ncbi:MAG TPA: response regulator transcription factor [Aggregatilineaceae bacterium]|nr:response regulator transcription factor [Aggregatilineaceae bacterium]
MRAVRILLIENERANSISFVVALQQKYQVQVAHTGKQALLLAQTTKPDVVVLDAASLHTSGNRICSRLRMTFGELPIIHIRAENLPGETSAANVILTPPFTPRKLINRIERFIAPIMVDEGKVLELGSFSLNLEKQMLSTPWNEKKLTPKLVALMEIFMKRPNETLGRRFLMQEVWKTDYMGDTRTLDVHIRWLRKIVEPEARKPRYLLTVRGEGYCFAVSL